VLLFPQRPSAADPWTLPKADDGANGWAVAAANEIGRVYFCRNRGYNLVASNGFQEALAMKRLAAMLVCALAGTLGAPTSWTSPPDSATNEVLAAEKARTTALDNNDLPALEKILADDLTYVHASGKVDTKATILEAIRSGQVRYISWTPVRLNARVSGDTGVLDGEYRVRVTDRRVKPDPFDVNIFVLAVYAQRGGRWQQIAWQSTRNVAVSPIECH